MKPISMICTGVCCVCCVVGCVVLAAFALKLL